MLTLKEGEVLGLVTKGLSNREIAGFLGINEKSVKFHITNLLAKKQVRSRAQLISLEMSRKQAEESAKILNTLQTTLHEFEKLETHRNDLMRSEVSKMQADYRNRADVEKAFSYMLEKLQIMPASAVAERMKGYLFDSLNFKTYKS